MSSVRMCDGCGFIFSENTEGWSNMTGNRMVRNPDTGKMENKSASVDYCDTCTENMTNGGQRPKPPTVNERKRELPATRAEADKF
jgi:hypothetical protein